MITSNRENLGVLRPPNALSGSAITCDDSVAARLPLFLLAGGASRLAIDARAPRIVLAGTPHVWRPRSARSSNAWNFTLCGCCRSAARPRRALAALLVRRHKVERAGEHGWFLNPVRRPLCCAIHLAIVNCFDSSQQFGPSPAVLAPRAGAARIIRGRRAGSWMATLFRGERDIRVQLQRRLMRQRVYPCRRTCARDPWRAPGTPCWRARPGPDPGTRGRRR